MQCLPVYNSYIPKFGNVELILVVHNVCTDSVELTAESNLNYVHVRMSIYTPDNTRLDHTSQNVHLRTDAYTKRLYTHVKVYYTVLNPSKSVHTLCHEQDSSNFPI